MSSSHPVGLTALVLRTDPAQGSRDASVKSFDASARVVTSGLSSLV